jgi:4-diphosphocytidyl-2-C-methyl-D-erythritol kinase
VRRLGDPPPFGLLVVPSAHALSTPAVYAEFDRLRLGRHPDELDRLSGQVPGAASDNSLLAERLLHNDLEAAACSLCPPIGDALADVRAAGAVRAMVSGSGPTVFGIFDGAEGATHARAAAAALRSRHPQALAATPVGRSFAAPVEV